MKLLKEPIAYRDPDMLGVWLFALTVIDRGVLERKAAHVKKLGHLPQWVAMARGLKE